MVEPITPAPAGPGRPRLVGRDRELELLREYLDAALAGRGALVLIGGEAGIGKTALAEALCREAQNEGALVLVGRCYDLGETPPYGPWREVFADAPTGDDLPCLPVAVLPAGHHGDVLTSREAVVERVRAYLVALVARQPLVLLLDDLHWADPASCDLLRFLVRQLPTHPVLLLATYRADELLGGHPLARLLPALVREGAPFRIDLRPLGREGIKEFVAARYPLPAADEARLIAYLHERTAGNPFFLREVLRTLEGEGALRLSDGDWTLVDLACVRVPPLLRQVIEGRVARLGGAARHALAVAAIIGQEVPLALWRAVAGLDDDVLLAVVEGAVAASLLAENADGTGVRFVHALVREALYEGVLAARRRRWHLQVAEALLAPRAVPDPDVVAYHLRRAGDARAATWLLRAGERAHQAYAWDTAAERYATALALLEEERAPAQTRVVLLIRLAQLCRYADPPRSLAYLEEAARVADGAGERALAAAALFDRGHLRCITGHLGLGLADMAAGLVALEERPVEERAHLPESTSPGATVDVHYRRGSLVYYLATVGRHAEAQATCAPLLAQGGRMTPRGLAGLGWADIMLGRPDEARRALVAAREAHRAAGQHLEASATLGQELWLVLCYRTDQLAERECLAAEAEAVWARAHGARTGVSPRWARVLLLLLEGGWAEARQLAQAAAQSAEIWRAGAVEVLGLLAREQGEATLAWALVREALPAGPAVVPGDRFFPATLALQRLAANLALDAGDLETARAWLAAHDRWLAWGGATLGRAEGHLGWARYYRAAGSPAALRHAHDALARAAAPRQPLALLAAHRLLGELGATTGCRRGVQDHFDQALALTDACAAPYERALTLLANAEWHVATGNLATAWPLLAEVRAICAPLDARPALARAAALRLTLAHPPAPHTPPSGYPANLTKREVEVLRLITRGRTNQEIAEHLSISPNTVLHHVTHILTKTATENRAAAAVFALRHGLCSPDLVRQ